MPLVSNVEVFAQEHFFEFRGRVVDTAGKPVGGATVHVRPSWGDGDLVEIGAADSDGRFVINKGPMREIPPYWDLFAVDETSLLANTGGLFMLGEVLWKENHPEFSGKRIRPNRTVVDLGDVKLQYRLFPVLFTLHDSSGRPLISRGKTRHGGFDPWWILRDIKGNILREGESGFDSFRYDKSGVMEGLPAGTWQIEVWDAEGFSISATKSVTVGETLEPQTIAFELAPLQLRFNGIHRYPITGRQAARRELAKQGYRFDQQTFKRVVSNGNDRIAEQFVKAGMNPNSSDGTGRFLTDSATTHPRLLKILLEAGADPNRKVIYGLTPLAAMIGNSNIQSLRMLLDAGADPSIRDERGKNAFDYAEDDEELLKLLESYQSQNARKKPH